MTDTTVDSPVETSPPVPSSVCLNCQNSLQGKFCSKCSQRDIGDKLTTPLLLGNLVEAITNTDFRLWTTLRDVACNPGRVALRYTHGARLTYINPVQFILWTFALYMGFLAAVGWLDAGIADSVKISIDGAEIEAEVQAYLRAMKDVVTKQLDIVTFLTMPIFAYLIRWQYRKAGHNFAETLVFVCFLFGLVYLISMLIAMLYYASSTDYGGSHLWLTHSLFYYGAKVFFRLKWWKAILGGFLSMMILGFIKWSVSSVLAIINLTPL